MKYLVITGGVISGIGKGIIASSTGLLLRSHGYNITAIKIDPYLNVDAGTMSPCQHGEVYVLEDGSEVDLDLGNYERFMDIKLTQANSITTGKVYSSVLQKERKGDYLGETVQIIPHITNEIQNMITDASNCGDTEICIVELGGTIGDIESSPFIESLRQLYFKVGKENFILVHVGLVPFSGEHKTKPMQHSIKTLGSLGLTPDIIICRSETPLSQENIQKVCLFSGVKNVINVPNLSNLYKVPERLKSCNYFDSIIQQFYGKNQNKECEISLYQKCNEISNIIENCKIKHKIAIVGKYIGSPDTYLSIVNALHHSSYQLNVYPEIIWVDSGILTDENVNDKLKDCEGILIPGGFGIKGIEGMVIAAKYARENNIPFLGICLGFQIALIEFARNVLNIHDANSEEMDPKSLNHVVIRMDDLDKFNIGGTMRLGEKKIIFSKNCKIKQFYDNEVIFERFRHRYEANPEYIDKFEQNGLHFVATDCSGKRMSIFELDYHPHFLGVQCHPEFKSRFYKTSPIFNSFLQSIHIKMA